MPNPPSDDDPEDDSDEDVGVAPIDVELLRKRSKMLSMLSDDEFEQLVGRTPEAIEAIYAETFSASKANALPEDSKQDDYDPDTSILANDVNRVYASVSVGEQSIHEARKKLAPVVEAARQKVKVSVKSRAKKASPEKD